MKTHKEDRKGKIRNIKNNEKKKIYERIIFSKLSPKCTSDKKAKPNVLLVSTTNENKTCQKIVVRYLDWNLVTNLTNIKIR